jgi:uncharacterized protein
LPIARPDPAPLRPAARLGVIDVARGLAVLGVGWCNAPAMAGLLRGPGDVPHPLGAYGRWIWVAGQVLWQGRLVALLSLLFGASMVWIGGDGGDPVRRGCLDRRLGWLAVMGVVHGAWLWWGDILLPYAVAGLALRPCRGWSARRLMLLGGAGYVLGVVALRVDDAWALWHHGAPRPFVPGPDHGVGGNVGIWLGGLPESLAVVLMTSGPMMALGMAMARLGWLTEVWLQRHAGRLLAVGLAAVVVCLPTAMLGVDLWPFPPSWAPGSIRFWAILLGLVSAPAGALGWLGVAAMVRGSAVLQAAGRGALSLYLLQSLMLRGGGWLLPAAFGYDGLVVLAGLALLAQVLWAWWWCGSGRQGPAEALWRGLYRR